MTDDERVRVKRAYHAARTILSLPNEATSRVVRVHALGIARTLREVLHGVDEEGDEG